MVLGICIFGGVFRLLEKMEVKITPQSSFSRSCHSCLRAPPCVCSKTRLLTSFTPPFSYLLITPNIYFLVFGITVICLWLSIRLQKAGGLVKDYHPAFAGFGLAWFLLNLGALLYFEDIVVPYVPVFVLGGAGTGLTFVFYLVARHLKSAIFTDPLNLSILLAHMLDASSTYIGIDKLGYFEKHVLPSYLIKLTDTALVMYPLKIIIFVGVLYALDTQFEKDDESTNLKMLIKMVILILGLSPATRNTIRMMLGI